MKKKKKIEKKKKNYGHVVLDKGDKYLGTKFKHAIVMVYK
jgi:hypothetical protein